MGTAEMKMQHNATANRRPANKQQWAAKIMIILQITTSQSATYSQPSTITG